MAEGWGPALMQPPGRPLSTCTLRRTPFSQSAVFPAPQRPRRDVFRLRAGRGQDGGGAGRGRLVPHRRHRRAGAQRRAQDHRPQEGAVQAGAGCVRARRSVTLGWDACPAFSGSRSRARRSPPCLPCAPHGERARFCPSLGFLHMHACRHSAEGFVPQAAQASFPCRNQRNALRSIGPACHGHARQRPLEGLCGGQHIAEGRCARLCAGEYIAPERIEGALKRAPMVQQVFVHGNPFESALVAVVVPDAAELRCCRLRRALATAPRPPCECSPHAGESSSSS